MSPVKKASPSSRVKARGAALPLPLSERLRELTTSSGMHVTAVQRGVIPVMAIRLIVAAGSSTDPAGKEGLADFTARLLRRGTRKRSADELNEAVEFVGATLSIGASEDYFSVSISTPAEHLEEMLDVLAELVREPAFPAKEVEGERERSVAQFANDLDDPSFIADRELGHALFGSHPYAHDIAGYAGSVKTFKREDLVRFHRERVGPRVAFLTLVGPVDSQHALHAADRAFAGWTGGPAAVQWPERPPALEKPLVRVVNKPDQTQSQVRLGAHGFQKGSPDLFPSIVMNVALGAGFTSRLMDEIRVNRGLSYGASSLFESLKSGGTFQVSSFTKTESTGELIAVALEAVEKMREKGLKPTELKTAQTYLCGLYPLRTETNEALAGMLGDMAIFGLGKDYVDKYSERARAVTLAQTKAVAQKYLFPRPPEIVVVGNASKIVKQLKRFGQVKVVEATELK